MIGFLKALHNRTVLNGAVAITGRDELPKRPVHVLEISKSLPNGCHFGFSLCFHVMTCGIGTAL